MLEQGGFHVNFPNAEKFAYEGKTNLYAPTSTSPYEQTALLSREGLVPRKLRINLLAPGFSLYFESGFRLRLNSMQAPFLTWTEGSVGADVPTPPQPWVLVSFREQQPPVMLNFPDGNCSVVVSGAPGQWVLHGVDTDAHWVRITAPLGTQAKETSNAAQLGELVRAIQPNLAFWTGPIPAFKNVDVQESPDSITATWHFDKPGALVPFAAQFAPLGDDPIAIVSPVKSSGVFTEEGEILACAKEDLTIRFPLLKPVLGRALAAGAPPVRIDPSGSAGISRDVALALADLQASCDLKTREEAEGLPAKFVAESTDSLEPFTGQRLPYDAAGNGLDRLAAAAFEDQATLSASGQTEQPNSLLLSLMLRSDPSRLTLWCDNDDLRRRSTALASLALLLNPSLNSRLQAAMFEAGLAAERGFMLWGSHRNLFAYRTLLEPMDSLRATLFGANGVNPPDRFVAPVVSPFHVFANFEVSASQLGDELTLSWMSRDETPKVMQLTFTPVSVAAGHNVRDVGLKDRTLTVQPADVGVTTVKLKLPTGMKLLDFASPPAFSEVRR